MHNRIFTMVLLSASSAALALDNRGNLEIQYSAFLEESNQATWQTGSVVKFDTRLSQSLADDSIKGQLYVQADYQEHEPESYNLTFREAFVTWNPTARAQVKAGWYETFWGVTESVNVVDVLNQRDLSFGLTDKRKITQPGFSLSADYGRFNWEGHVLSDFQARRFPDQGNRPALPVSVFSENAIYEQGSGFDHFEFATRGQVLLGPMETAVSVFRGYNREPTFVLQGESAQIGQLISTGALPSDHSAGLRPNYEVITHIGHEAVLFVGNSIMKSELVYRKSDNSDWWLAVVGGEYSLYSLFGSFSDLTFFVEYLLNTREEEIDPFFADDVFLGLRLNLNNPLSTTLEAGAFLDTQNSEQLYTAKVSSRINSYAKFELSTVVFNTESPPTEEELLFELVTGNTIDKPLSFYGNDNSVVATLKLFW